MGVTTVFGCSGVDVQRFLHYADKENPATYADWSVAWPQDTTGNFGDETEDYLLTFHIKIREGG